MRCSKIISPIILSFFFVSSYAQRFQVSNDSMNIVYVGIFNPLTVLVEGTACDALILKTNNGSIRRWQDSTGACRFIHTPSFAGDSRVDIYKRAGTKKITEQKVGSWFFKADYLPPPMSYDRVEPEWPN